MYKVIFYSGIYNTGLAKIFDTLEEAREYIRADVERIKAKYSEEPMTANYKTDRVQLIWNYLDEYLWEVFS